jgi:hypothetical protein
MARSSISPWSMPSSSRQISQARPPAAGAGRCFPAGSQAYGAAADSAGSSPSIEIADALLGLASYGSGCPARGASQRGLT